MNAAIAESVALHARPTWRRFIESRYLLGGGYALATLLTVVGVALASSPPATGPIGPASQTMLVILALNLVLILALAGLVGWRVLKLLAVRSSDAGARLHLRFISLFALAAVVPAVIVALFFGVLVTRGVEGWFSERVRTVVENSATVARSYVDEQTGYIRDHMFLMAGDLNRAAPALESTPVTFGHFLAYQASYHAFPGVYILDRDGRVLARAEAEDPPPFLAPPASSFAAADEGDISMRPFESADLIRALYKLKDYPDAYLYVARPVDRGILNHLRETEASLNAYGESARNRERIQVAFALSYLETALLVLVGAIWLGMAAAGAIAAPVARLVKAAGRVSAGDLDARVRTDNEIEELSVLSRAFNQMTEDLQRQQAALKAASEDAEGRRQFIETVLLGVSAGVLGVDGKGRVSAANRQAGVLLGLTERSLGQPLAKAAPELADIAARAVETGGEIEEEVDVVRGSETRRLRVRASAASAESLVLTFDDITRLVSAQRNAAWRDVARRIAHEIKNPLTPIQLSAERLRRKYRKEITGDLETFDRCTETIVRQVGDIGRMVDEFSAFARMPAPKFAEVDPAELLREAVFSQRVANPDIQMEIEEPAEPLRLTCDSRMVGQALTNLIKNAVEATTAAGHPVGKGRIAARLARHGAGLAFEIEDNGVGLPAKDRDRLTEPYVTTREKGTGLGLAIVKRIAEDHGGELTLADARKGRGARVTLHFPNARVAEAAPRTPELIEDTHGR
ncbi:MAG TPA: PAS domain-containing sensor histidine kinase [Caulobacteraceae bacterium]|nr:PAS domain-containing sensor histidine kinase [Caulobacteraceae bacterium]